MSKMGDHTYMQPCWVLGISLWADTTVTILAQVTRATSGLVAPSLEQRHGRGCHRNPGAGQVLQVVGPPVAWSLGASCGQQQRWVRLPPPSQRWGPCQQNAGASLCHFLLPASQAAMSKTGMDFPVYPTLIYLPKSTCTGFVFLSSYISEVKQRAVANGIILTHLCRCY